MGLAEMFRMSGVDLPVGPEADLREIEYLSALHQTCPNPIRSDGTISSEDVQVYLRSRYGLDIPVEECAAIVRGLAGTAKASNDDDEEDIYPTPELDEGAIMALARSTPSSAALVAPEKTNIIDDNEYFDLIQFMAVLLIPTLQRAKRQVDIEEGIIKTEPIPDLPDTNWRLAFTHPKIYHYNRKIAKDLTRQKKEREFHNSLEPSDEDGNIIRMVLRVLFAGINVNGDSNGEPYTRDLPQVIVNKQTVGKLLDAFGFSDLSSDKILVSQMVQAAGGPGTIFNEMAFARALTADVDLRKVGIEDDMSETFEDVYGVGLLSLEYVVGRRINLRRQNKAENVAAYYEKKHIVDVLDEEKGVLGPNTPATTMNSSPVPSSNYSSASDSSKYDGFPPASGEDDEWVSFDDDDKTVDWSKAKATEVNVSTDGEIEVHASKRQLQATATSSIASEPKIIEDAGDSALIETKKPTHVPTAPYIDYVLDEYKSIALLCAIWVFYLFGGAAFMSMLGLVDLQLFKCTDGFLCKLVQQVWTWLVFGVMLSLGGLIVVMPLSLGNDPHRKDLCGAFISFIWAILFGTLPYALLKSYKDDIPHSSTGELNETEKLLSQPAFKLMAVIFFVFGLLIAVKMLTMIPNALIPNSVIRKSNVLSYLFVPSSTRSAAATKQAATRKLNRMIDQARSMHFQTQLGEPVSALDQFLLCGQTAESCGGLFWTWKEILSGRLVKWHGIWLQSNLLVGQEGQIMVLLFGLVLGIWGARQLAESLAQQRRDLEAEPPSYLRDQALYFTPYPWNIYVSFGVGTGLAGIIGLTLLALYIPSTVATVLKLRTGLIGTFQQPLKYGSFRAAADTTCYNVGNMIYALIGSCSLFFLIGGGIVFLMVWQPTRDFMINLIGWGLGLGITIGLKMVITICLRANFQQALYRKKPRSANVTGLCLMCWNIALGAGVMLGRLTQFLLAAAFWIGRVDANFLDDEVKLFGYGFDYVPANFRKDILVTEAHRHPWLDRIGGMYMMRHHYGTAFGTNAGARWRQLFTAALMPWLKKYRNLRNLDMVLEGQKQVDSLVEASTGTGLSPEQSAQLSVLRQRRRAAPQDAEQKSDFMGSF